MITLTTHIGMCEKKVAREKKKSLFVRIDIVFERKTDSWNENESQQLILIFDLRMARKVLSIWKNDHVWELFRVGVNIELVVIITMKLTKSDAEMREEGKMKNFSSFFFFVSVFGFFSFFIHQAKWHIHIQKREDFHCSKVREIDTHAHCSSWIMKHWWMIDTKRWETLIVPIGILKS